MSGPIDYLAKVAKGDGELFANMLQSFMHAIETDSRTRYEYTQESHLNSIDFIKMNEMGDQGWEAVQVLESTRSNGIPYAGVYGTNTIYNVIYKRPWIMAQPEDTHE